MKVTNINGFGDTNDKKYQKNKREKEKEINFF